jgi:hypothetical protein
VARGDACQHRARQHGLAVHGLAGGDDGERTRRRDAERVHGLAHQGFAQHRPDGRLAVAAAGEGRPPRALESDVEAPALAIEDLAEQHGAAIAELRREASELVAGVGLGDRLRAFRHGVAGEQGGAGVAGERVGVESHRLGERAVEEEPARTRHGGRLPRHREAVELAGVGGVEGDHGASSVAPIGHPDRA